MPTRQLTRRLLSYQPAKVLCSSDSNWTYELDRNGDLDLKSDTIKGLVMDGNVAKPRPSPQPYVRISNTLTGCPACTLCVSTAD